MIAARAKGVIESARLRLREIHAEDAPLILEVLTDPDFIANVGDRGVHGLTAARSYIADKIVPSYGSHGFGMYLVELRANAASLGICGLLRRDSHPDVEIGRAQGTRARLCPGGRAGHAGLCPEHPRTHARRCPDCAAQSSFHPAPRALGISL